ncbi:hypothetical protein Ait01nite_006730 [Actinoplanes italicus]|uniref:Alanine--tRNA ligase n=1 Tax=Actinoplanes italicus TaxID=113567 RepID=A0A2T0KLX3_9ACTN|nr:hypothetical protein CLV67_102421 [Actinoplanes italicus]GIE27628.1 hypothetical protein Ait01nite_006730 [Actinoplanes italicus]
MLRGEVRAGEAGFAEIDVTRRRAISRSHTATHLIHQVNEILLQGLVVHAFITSPQQARRLGAIALFGEKYGEQVRVVEVGDYAREEAPAASVSNSSPAWWP